MDVLREAARAFRGDGGAVRLREEVRYLVART